jgi:SAM-dependent methyltransferase
MSAPGQAQRICIACQARDPILPGEAVWPVGWHCPACGQGVPEHEGIPMFASELADTVSGFDPVWLNKLVRIEANHFWFVARNELIVGLARRFFPAATRYLEIGCGNGAVLGALASSRSWQRLVGIELHPTGLRHTRARLSQPIEFVQMDARAVPAVNAFDLAGAFDVIEHISDDLAVLRGLRRALSDGGGAMIAVPQHPALWSHLDEIGHHQRRYRRGELEDKLRQSGFEILFSSSFTALLLPLMLLSRWRARAATNDAEVERELGIAPALNALLKAILRAEVHLTLAGLRWPAGGSRVVVARAV